MTREPFAIFFSLLLAFNLYTSAQGQANTEFSVVQMTGTVAIDWYFPLQLAGLEGYRTGGENLRGLLLGGQLSLATDELEATLAVLNTNLERQGFTFQVTHRYVLGLMEFESARSVSAENARSSNLTTVLALSPPELPKAQVTLVKSMEDGEAGYETLSFEIQLSDRYRNLTAELSELDWKVAYIHEGTSFAVPAVSDRFAHGLSATLSSQLILSAAPHQSLSPGFGIDFRWTVGETRRFRQRYRLDVEAEVTDTETLSVEGALTLETERPVQASVSFGVATSYLKPFIITTGVVHLASGEINTFAFELGGLYAVSQTLRLSADYTGTVGDEVRAHTLGFGLDYQERPWLVRFRADGGLRATGNGPYEPDLNILLTSNYRDRGPFQLQARGKLQYRRGFLTSSLDFSASYKRSDLALSGTTGFLYTRGFAFNFEVDALVPVGENWSAHAAANFQSKFVSPLEANLTLGIGLRYNFGGNR